MLELYRNIKRIREEKGMSQDELAKLVGFKSRSSINKIEMGVNDITQSKLIAIARALHVSPGELMGEDKEIASPTDLSTHLPNMFPIDNRHTPSACLLSSVSQLVGQSQPTRKLSAIST